VVGQDQLRRPADAQRLQVKAQPCDLVHLLHQRQRLQHRAVADDTQHPRPRNPRRDLVQLERPFAHHHRMAGIVAALVTGHHLRLGSQQIDHSPLAFIAPLGAQHNQSGHLAPPEPDTGYTPGQNRAPQAQAPAIVPQSPLPAE